MSVRSDTAANLPRVGFGMIVGIGVFVGIATAVALNVLTPVKLAFILGGFALLIPTMVLKDPKAYWLFLLVLSIPFDISKWLFAEQFDTEALIDKYGMPASGTISLEVYLTDVVLLAMLLPWLARICMRQEEPYFPKIGYLFVLYLVWALLASLINAESFQLSFFELFRELLYFLLFMYLINNVRTRLQFRSVIWAVLLGFIIGCGTVIIFFQQGTGTQTSIFASLHDQPATSAKTRPGNKGRTSQNLTLHASTSRFFANRGQGDIIRSQGMFRHPAIPASLCGLTLPIILAYLMTTGRKRDRILYLVVFAVGLLALFLTFSRAGLLGFIGGVVVFFAVGAWSGLMSRRVFKISAVILTVAVVLSIPLLVIYLQARPQSVAMRFHLFNAALQAYGQHPILGVGLNNSTAAMNGAKQVLIDMGIPVPRAESADSYYLAVLMEVGPLGSLFLYLFLGNLVAIALRATREATADMKPLLVGMVAGLASLATQNIADAPMAGHAVSGLLWLYAALIVATVRSAQAGGEPPLPEGMPRRSAPHLRPPMLTTAVE